MLHYIYLGYGYQSDYKTKVELIKKVGFDGVFVFWHEQLLEELCNYIRKQNLDIESIHMPFKTCNELWKDTPMGEDYCQLMINGINEASKLNIKTIVMHISSGNEPPEMSNIGIERINKILKVCEEKQVNLALENLRRLDYLDKIYESCQSHYLKFCFDSGHANAFTKNIYQFEWEKYQNKLICVHLHDNDGYSDLHKLPFTGNIDWQFVGSKFKEINYQGPLTLEVVNKHQLEINEELYIKKAKTVLEKIEEYIK